MEEYSPMEETMDDMYRGEDDMQDDMQDDMMYDDAMEQDTIEPEMLSPMAKQKLMDDTMQTEEVTNMIKNNESEYYKYPYPSQMNDEELGMSRDPVTQKREIKYNKSKMKHERPNEMVNNILSHLTQSTVTST